MLNKFSFHKKTIIKVKMFPLNIHITENPARYKMFIKKKSTQF